MPCSTAADYWWDATWNVVGGCWPVGPGCLNCYAAGYAVTHTHPWLDGELHRGVAERKGDRFRWNGNSSVLPPGHHMWNFPTTWPGAEYPKLGRGMPSLIFVADMSDLLYEKHPADIVTKACYRIAISRHIGLICSHRPQRVAEYFGGIDARTVRRWQPKMWLGFSAERQQEFDEGWPHMRRLAEQGWLTFVSLAPMIQPVVLPPDFLALGSWVIVSGETRTKYARVMEDNWARAIRDQCAEAGIPFYMLQMTKATAIPPDLLRREFPKPLGIGRAA